LSDLSGSNELELDLCDIDPHRAQQPVEEYR